VHLAELAVSIVKTGSGHRDGGTGRVPRGCGLGEDRDE
jgi:hypothetical protein